MHADRERETAKRVGSRLERLDRRGLRRRRKHSTSRAARRIVLMMNAETGERSRAGFPWNTHRENRAAWTPNMNHRCILSRLTAYLQVPILLRLRLGRGSNQW